MKSRDIVFASTEAGADTVGTEMFDKLAQNTLNMFATEIARHIRDDEAPGVLSPVEVILDGKDRLGAILLLSDRAILAWSTGMLRTKNFEEVIPLSTITDAIRGARPGGGISKPRETLTIHAENTWPLVFANMFEGGRSIVPILAGLLVGAIRPVFGEGDDQA